MSYSSCISFLLQVKELIFLLVLNVFMKFIICVLLLMMFGVKQSTAVGTSCSQPRVLDCWWEGNAHGAEHQPKAGPRGAQHPSAVWNSKLVELQLAELPSWNSCAHAYHWILFPKALLWYYTEMHQGSTDKYLLHLPDGSFLFHQNSSSFFKLMLAFGVSLSTWFQWEKIKGKQSCICAEGAVARAHGVPSIYIQWRYFCPAHVLDPNRQKRKAFGLPRPNHVGQKTKYMRPWKIITISNDKLLFCVEMNASSHC